MFIIYNSNRLEFLLDSMTTIVKNEPISNIFSSEIVLVQSNNMAEWIKIFLTRKIGIVANIEFILPGRFIWKKLLKIFNYLPDENFFLQEIMIWKIMKILPNIIVKKEFFTIQSYLKNDIDQKKCFQLSVKIADLFDQYLVFRPDWLENWQNKKLVLGLPKEQIWQSILWRELIKNTKIFKKRIWNRSVIYQEIIKNLSKKKINLSKLPNRIFVFNISLLPPIYLTILKKLSNHIDVHVFFVNPCRHYWEDIDGNVENLISNYNISYNSKSKKKTFFKHKNDNSLFNSIKMNNSLLSSWGKQGSDNLYLLNQLEETHSLENFINSTDNCLLSKIQNDILNFKGCIINNLEKEKNDQKTKKRTLNKKDRSISFNICHSPKREVEVLKDNIFATIKKDTTIGLKDILIMVSDIDIYSPIIESVFNTSSKDNFLPFNILNKKEKKINLVFSVFFDLINLLKSRFSIEQVLELLEVPFISSKFSIKEKHFQLLKKWIIDSGIRFGLDKNTCSDFSLPIIKQNTWKWGLDRMLLGYAINNKNGKWKNIIPYNQPNDFMVNLIGYLSDFISLLKYWKNNLSNMKTLNEWIKVIEKIIDGFFLSNEDIKSELIFLKKSWKEMLQFGIKSEYDKPISITLLYEKFFIFLNKKRSKNYYSPNFINICTLVPMRSIPFKVIYLLGMNDGIYPRPLKSTEFDLMIYSSKKGDRNRRNNDRYLFLESLLSVRKKFYISFVGYNMQNNVILHPSLLVSELLDYISQNFFLDGDENISCEITRKKRIRNYIVIKHNRTVFSSKNFLPNSENQSFFEEWIPIVHNTRKTYENFTKKLKKISVKELSLNDLCYFYSNPIRYWFQKRLKISFSPIFPVNLEENEPFLIHGLTRYKINCKIIDCLINNKNISSLFYKIKFSGLLPYGSFGELYWEKEKKKLVKLSKKIKKFYFPNINKLEIYLKINGIILSGWLSHMKKDGLLQWKVTNISEKDGLLLWINHIAYCAMGGKGKSRILGTSNNKWIFPELSVCQATEFLSFLIKEYLKGMQFPLFLLNYSGGTWLTNCFDKKKKEINYEKTCQKKAKEKFMHVWNGNNFSLGENNDPYIKKVIKKLNKKNFDTIINVTKKVLLAPFIFNLN